MGNDNNDGGFCVQVYGSGNNIAKEMTITYNGDVFNGQRPKEEVSFSDDEIAQALTKLVGKNKAIDSKQKWAGAHWGLRWLCNYPVKAQDFCDKIDTLPLPPNLEFKCDYNNIRPLSTLSFMNEDPRNMEQVKYSKNDEQTFFQMRSVFVALREELQFIASKKMGF